MRLAFHSKNREERRPVPAGKVLATARDPSIPIGYSDTAGKAGTHRCRRRAVPILEEERSQQSTPSGLGTDEMTVERW